eukprot:6211454-Pleurochrysis_carterae.AAC.1
MSATPLACSPSEPMKRPSMAALAFWCSVHLMDTARSASGRRGKEGQRRNSAAQGLVVRVLLTATAACVDAMAMIVSPRCVGDAAFNKYRASGRRRIVMPASCRGMSSAQV